MLYENAARAAVADRRDRAERYARNRQLLASRQPDPTRNRQPRRRIRRAVVVDHSPVQA